MTTPEGALLIVNADDYGLTEGISDGILRAHEDGILTSTSVIALGPAFESTVGRLRSSSIGVGAHLALVGEDAPLLSAREIPTLVGRTGRLAASWRAFLPRVAAGRVDLDDVRRELAAQLERLLATGVPVSHVDSHQHLHLWPSIGRVVVELARSVGISGMRITRSTSRAPAGLAVRAWSRQLERCAQANGIQHPEDGAGLDEAGGFTPGVLRRTIRELGLRRPRTAEIGTHPGAAHDPDRERYRWGYAWGEELEALTHPRTRDEVHRAGFRLGTYQDL